MLTQKAEARIRQYLAFLDEYKYDSVAPLSFESLETADFLRSPPRDGWKRITLPHHYGKEWTTYWFRTEFSFPKEAAGKEVFLRAKPNADSLVFVDGTPAGAVNPLREKLRLTDSAKAGKACAVHLESYAGHSYTGMMPLQRPSIILTLSKHISHYPIDFESADLAVKSPAVYALYYDSLVLFELSQQLEADSLRRSKVLHDLYAALMEVRFTARGDELARQAAAADKSLQDLLAARNGTTAPTIYIMGHAHIDHAWLWPLAETERKAARTFSSMCRLAEEFPEFHFLQSQPAQLDAVRREYPAVFAEVKKAFAKGQWEPNGGMWVEADCNIPSGESLIRQFLVGKAATRDMLGYEGDTLWLPDVFGYAAALPQILAGCGIRWFVTSKINWNDTTRFPYDTFLWRGIDGTGVPTHYITSRINGYNGRVRAQNLFDCWKQVQHKDVQSGVISSIGEGDGGGGTMRSDLEYARRLQDLEGAPRVAWTTVTRALESIFGSVTDLPTWEGELYLELHRGTYTTQARTKRNNRTQELALRETELLSAAAVMLGLRAEYPHQELLECWKKLLTNQFHDIIPGSSIARVYQDAEKSYGEIRSAAGRLTADAKKLLAAGLNGPVVAFNALSWARSGLAVLPWNERYNKPADLAGPGEPAPVQVGKTLDDEPQAAAFLGVPAMGMAAYRPQPASGARPSAFSVQADTIQTPFYMVEMDGARRITHLLDKESGRDIVKSGELMNRLVTAEDVPTVWDAWDVEADWTRSMKDEDRLQSSQVISSGPVFLQVRNTYKIGESSTLRQDMIFYSGQRRIDFRTRVDWHENHRLLKAAFPVNVLTTEARCEVQYGHVKRGTTANLPTDRARFEFCAHKWICVEEAGFGVALLNDCKYGHDVRGPVMRITLLRSPKAPDPEADMGVHYFTYSLLPYQGGFSVETVVRQAYDLNVPLSVLEAGSGASGPPQMSLMEVDCPEVIVEAVKQAEDGSGVVVRLYEASGGSRKAALTLHAMVAGAWESDMLERNRTPLDHGPRSVPLAFRPFEIKTVVLALKRA